MTTIKLAIADDHALFRKGLLSLIESQITIDIVAEGGNGKELLSAIDSSKQIPDIAIVDLSMPVMNGYDLIPYLQERYPTCKILIISLVIEPNAIQHLFNIGVHGFIDKSDAKCNFNSVFMEIIEFGYYKNKHYLPQQKEPLNWKKNKFHGTIPFTHAEMEFIKFKVDGYELKEIADKMFLTLKAIDYHRSNLYRKLGISTREELIEYAKTIGLEKWGN
ncbi:MAG: response regulator transcription factor [Sphingobacteriia bacterium]|jgi:DNA-binding NarL/FixJ family response regulator